VVALWLSGVSTVTLVSALAGGAVAIVPQAYFGFRAFRYAGARSAQRAAQSFYRGEFAKFALTAMGFSLVFALLRPLDGLAVFIGFMGMTLVHWVGAWWLTRARKPG